MWTSPETGPSFIILITISAVAIDLAIGDPRFLPHPVRLIGKTLEALESIIRTTGTNLRFAGLAATIFLSCLVFFCVDFLTGLKALGTIAAIYFSYAGLALGELVREGRKVANLVNENRLEDARAALSMLVSRETADMDADRIRSSLAETISENLSDAFVAPLFYLVLLGPAGMWAYKAISTMDSMWGYKNLEYSELGWAPARTDDLLAFLPSRITALVMVAVTALSGGEWRKALANMGRDAGKMESPNAGWPMSAAAWIFAASMGGRFVYFGEAKEKPRLGPDGVWTAEKINALLRLCLMSGLLTCAIFLAAAALVFRPL